MPVELTYSSRKRAPGGDLTGLKAINATTTTYDENWSVEQPDYHLIEDKTHNYYLNSVSPTNLTYSGDLFDSNRNFFYRGGAPGPAEIYDNVLDANTYYRYNAYDYTDQGEFNNWLNIAGVYPDLKFQQRSNNNDVFTFYTTLNVTNAWHPGAYTGNYYMGFGSTVCMRIFIDDVCVPDANLYPFSFSDFPRDHYGWNLIPINLSLGKHILKVELLKYNPFTAIELAAGMEIYDNTLNDLENQTGIPKLIRFSLRDLVGNLGLQASLTSNGKTYNHYSYTDAAQTPADPCNIVPTAINPFLYGFKGNWRPYQTKVFQQKRVDHNDIKASSGINVKNIGYIDQFFSNWYCPSAKSPWIQNMPATSNKGIWVTANTITQYDKYGQQLENKDALLRYSAAKFSFNGELPSAVASNAMNREIYYGGYEDTDLTPNLIIGAVQESDFYPSFNYYSVVSNGGHSGKRSVVLPTDGVTLSTQVYSSEQKNFSSLAFDSNNQFIKILPDNTKSGTLGLYPNGFEPVPNQIYTFSAWVKDENPYLKSLDKSLTISVNHSSAAGISINTDNVALSCKAIVEGWKLVEGSINLASYNDGDKLKISITPKVSTTGNSQHIYIDDIRIHPKDSHMKTYAYDYSNMRLMAELDENNFATFYEYDSQGLLIRVKKETERGIMTLKESRSSYIKK